jgi:hypothetical protein
MVDTPDMQVTTTSKQTTKGETMIDDMTFFTEREAKQWAAAKRRLGWQTSLPWWSEPHRCWAVTYRR